MKSNYVASGETNELMAVLLALTLLALTVSGIIVTAGWQRRRDLMMRRSVPGRPPAFEVGQIPFESGMLDVAAEARAVLRQLEG
jgi:hypothetical protein